MIGKYEEQAYQSTNARRAPDPDDVIAQFGLDYLTGSAVSLILQAGGSIGPLRLAVEKLRRRIEIAEAASAAEHRRVEQRMATLVAEVPR